MIAKPISIKLTGGKSGGCALKAVELTSGDLRHVTEIVTEGEAIHPDRVAEVSSGQSRSGSRQGFQGTPTHWTGSLCSLGFDGDQFVAQLFSLPFEFCFQPFFPLGVSSGPQGLVIFDLVFDHGVKDHRDLVGGCHGGSFGAELGFHSAQVVAEWGRAVMEGKGCQAE